MKLFRVLLLLASATAVTVAQTNEPQTMVVQTNVPQTTIEQTEGSQTRALSLQDCIQQALQHNLRLQIVRYNPSLALHAVKAAQAGYDPGFSFSGEHSYSETAGSSFDPNTGLPRAGSISETDRFDSSLGGLLPWGLNYSFFGNVSESYGTTVGTNKFNNARGAIGVNLSQPLLKNFWIDATRLSIRSAKIGLKQSDLALSNEVMIAVTETENAYYNLVAARESVKVREKALELADRLLAENKKRVEVGALAPLDEKQAESQVATARADLLAARQLLAVEQNSLKSLITDSYADLHDVELEPTESLEVPLEVFDLQDSWNKAMTQRPDLLQVRLDLEQQGIQLKFDRNQLYPQLDLTGSYGYNAGGVTTVDFGDAFGDFSAREQPFHSYGAILSFPLSNRGARNNYKASKIAVQQALLAVKSLEQSILVEVDNAITSVRASYERVDARRQASLYAEAALEAEQKKLESGKSTSFNVLQLQRDLTDARSQEIAARTAYIRSLAALALAEGSTLERRDIDMEVESKD
jgi:outer membrane protein TolC